jgi:hypothetical protein
MTNDTGKGERKGRYLTSHYILEENQIKYPKNIYQKSVPTTEIISEKLFYLKLARPISKNGLKWIKHKQIHLFPPGKYINPSHKCVTN